ncbi:MAG: branched-chain amino acid ABC transporter permease [Archaeoglobus sp.]|jgi:branched-chain amino acid transport system permease protein|nr:branched-chain amino acid ABC transporter permease [Archaeoglobus sp.]
MKSKIAQLIALSVFLSLLPLFTPPAYLYIIGLGIVFAVIVASWDLIVGYAGQVNLGHTTFVGLGAYTAAILQVPSRIGMNLEIHPILSIILAGTFSAIVALGIGIVTLRLKGYYFSLVTAILPLVFMQKVFIWKDIFGGEEGFSIPVEKVVFAATIEKYYFALLFMFLSILFMLYISNSKLGIRFKAIRDSEELSESLGINVTYYKVLAVVISSFFAGMAGAIFVNYRHTVAPDLYDVPLMLLIILSAVIGGLGSLIGPLLMGLVIYLAKNWWLTFLKFGILNEEVILYAILIAIAILMPEGVYGRRIFLKQIIKKLQN